MINKEKVIKGLEACTAWDGLHQCQPKFYGYDCPYDDEADCKVELMKDALSLLKEQETLLEEYHKADGFLTLHGWWNKARK